MEERRTKQKKKRSEETIDYFNEDQFMSEIFPLVQQDKKLPDSFAYSMFNITDGMINTEFRNNLYVLSNREELKQCCFFEIMKSIKKFKGEKGRSFAYFNRIIKNTLLREYYKHIRRSSKECKIYDLLPNDYTEAAEELSLEEAITAITKDPIKSETKPPENSLYFSNCFDKDYSKDNVKNKKNPEDQLIDSSLLKYLNYCLQKINFILSYNLDDFYFDMKYAFNSEYTDGVSKEDLIIVLNDTKKLFSYCMLNLLDRIDPNYLKAIYEDKISQKCLLINYKVLGYVRREISNRKLRSYFPSITTKPKISAAIIKFLLDI